MDEHREGRAAGEEPRQEALGQEGGAAEG